MEYFLILILQLGGIGLHVFQKVKDIDSRYPDDTLKDVFKIFLREDAITLFASILILILNLVVHYIIGAYTTLPTTIEYYILYAFGIALLLGYAGQRLVYKYLGKAEEVLSKRLDSKLGA